MSRDPIGEKGGLNLYGYVGNRPSNFIDPDGSLPFLAPIAIMMFRGAAIGAVTSGVGAIIVGNNPFEAAADGIFGGAVGSLLGWGTGSVVLEAFSAGFVATAVSDRRKGREFNYIKCFALGATSAGVGRYIDRKLHPEAGSGIASSIGAGIDSLFGDTWDFLQSRLFASSDEEVCRGESCTDTQY